MLVAFTTMTIRQGQAYFDLFIEKFEVTRKYKGTGYGRRMYQWLESNYRINIIELEHMSELIDKGASHRFWLHMGFHKPSAVGSLMCKRISGK
jgi:GNAT superfamily N-acetyltransferase